MLKYFAVNFEYRDENAEFTSYLVKAENREDALIKTLKSYFSVYEEEFYELMPGGDINNPEELIGYAEQYYEDIDINEINLLEDVTFIGNFDLNI